MPTPLPDASSRTIVPNDIARRVRRHYLVLLTGALGLGFATFLLAGNGVLAPVVTLALLISAAGLLIFAVLVLRSGVCPRCASSLMWKEASSNLTSSRISLLTKARCPSCGLDLEQPFDLQNAAPGLGGRAQP